MKLRLNNDITLGGSVFFSIYIGGMYMNQNRCGYLFYEFLGPFRTLISWVKQIYRGATMMSSYEFFIFGVGKQATNVYVYVSTKQGRESTMSSHYRSRSGHAVDKQEKGKYEKKNRILYRCTIILLNND